MDRQTDRQTERQTDRQTDRQTKCGRKSVLYKGTAYQLCLLAGLFSSVGRASVYKAESRGFESRRSPLFLPLSFHHSDDTAVSFPPHTLTRLGWVWLPQTLLTTLWIEGLPHVSIRQTDREAGSWSEQHSSNIHGMLAIVTRRNSPRIPSARETTSLPPLPPSPPPSLPHHPIHSHPVEVLHSVVPHHVGCALRSAGTPVLNLQHLPLAP